MIKRKSTLFIILLIYFLVSCATTKKVSDQNKNVMFAMIYDMESNPLSGAEIYINGELQGTSDVQGRFLFSDPKTDTVKIKITKPYYSEIETEIIFNPMQVGYFRTGTAGQYFNIAKESLSRGDIEKAEFYENKALELSPDRSDILYLESIILNKKGNKKNSNEILLKIQSSDENNLYINKLKELNNEDK